MKNRKSEERTNLRDRFWPGAKAWTGEDSKGWFRAPRTFPRLQRDGDIDAGWFRAPRTFPLLLTLLKSKALSGRQDPSSAYLALWARHLDSGIVD